MYTLFVTDRATGYETRLLFGLALNAILEMLRCETYAVCEVREGDFTKLEG